MSQFNTSLDSYAQFIEVVASGIDQISHCCNLDKQQVLRTMENFDFEPYFEAHSRPIDAIKSFLEAEFLVGSEDFIALIKD